ncbi:MAG: DNA-formamidopyrimidine glycosylase family protein [Pseudomonadota bacterium]
MPELPDITAYIDALRVRLEGHALEQVQISSPFLLRTASPPVDVAVGHCVTGFERLGKRIALGFDNDVWWVLHLMIAGRLRWRAEAPKRPSRTTLAVFTFDGGVLTLTEAGTKKRASLHVVEGSAAMRGMNPGGLEVMDADLESFSNVFTARNHTLKRALTDPRILSGIGNAYSDEILHRAGLSPVKLTQSLSADEIATLYAAVRDVLGEWTEKLRQESREKFPEKVTAFRPDMAVHGRYGKPCPVCGSEVQRIRYASNETNYCPRCQTGGRLLADRSLSRLLKKDWPRSIEELEKSRGENS